MLLRGQGEELCSRCHDAVAPAGTDPALVHAPARGGECRACHGGHEGTDPGLLHRAPPGLCAECHGGVVERAGLSHGHAPAAEGECATCHEPHAGREPGLLASTPRELCAGCHDPQDPAAVRGHRSIAIGGGDCAGCHDPHGSDRPGLFPPFAHGPYEEGRCEVCHSGPGGALEKSGAAACVGCHGDHAADAARSVPHAPLLGEEGCVACHSPHAGKTAALLRRDSVASTCFSCHDRAMFAGEVRHPEQECGTCHAPHGSETPGMLIAPQSELCLGCHDVAASHVHPYQGPALDPRTGEELTCTSCHAPHSGSFETLLTHDRDRALCVQCHLGPNLEVKGIER
jgi:predicted CXXCH cytochrome family protein